MLLNMDIDILLVAFFFVFLAFLVRGMTGFGSGLILTPLLAIFVDIKDVVVLATFIHIFAGVYMAVTSYKSADTQLLKRTLLVSSGICFVGSFILSSSMSRVLLVILGCLTVLYALYMLLRKNNGGIANSLTERGSLSAGNLALGAASGFFHGLYGTGGPPIIVLFDRMIHDKETMRSTLNLYFLVLDFVRLAAYVVLTLAIDTVELISFENFRLSLLLLFPTALGAITGSRMHSWVSERRFRKLVAIILLFAGIAIFLRAMN
ncbi:MAG: sulfite exporter TauE/SafE family protein [Anaerolineales bacterium]|nr:sulfite exporter TauE/SafE family protein [Anaerolineales bacterium]